MLTPGGTDEKREEVSTNVIVRDPKSLERKNFSLEELETYPLEPQSQPWKLGIVLCHLWKTPG